MRRDVKIYQDVEWWQVEIHQLGRVDRAVAPDEGTAIAAALEVMGDGRGWRLLSGGQTEFHYGQ